MSQEAIFNNLQGGGLNTNMPYQQLPRHKKGKDFLKQNSDFFYTEALKQVRRNSVFSDIRKMTDGEFTYRAVDIEKTLMGTSHESEYKKLASDVAIATHLKHFDFLGICANAIISVFSEIDDLYRVEASDEHSTNDYIRARTEKYQQYGQALLKAEINKILLERGINPNQEEFKSEEEQQQYQQMLEQEVQKLTPEEVEKDLAKNFKVIAVDWANNVISVDKKKHSLDKADKVALLDYILTGRWFRHYKVGYDYYKPEHWLPEETFFSQEIDTEYPQDCEYVGRLTKSTLSQALVSFGHLMTTKEQEKVGDYWGQSKNPKTGTGLTGEGTEPFATNYIVPFHNYFDHNINLQMEDALGAPLAQTKDKDTGEVTRHWMPRSDFGAGSTNSAKHLRTDIDIRNDMVDVMEVYWRSFEKIGVLIFRNEVGALEVKQTSEELLKDFLEENEIKVKRSISLNELQQALREERLEEYENTICYHYIPEIWHMVTIKGTNSITNIDDIILDGNPILQQIEGDSKYYHRKIPVGGLIGKSPITKAFPYQQLHNICLNQITELLADEPGTFYSIDINSLAQEYKDQDTTEALFSLMDTIKMTKLLPMDLSRTNTQGSTVYPNVFQRNEMEFSKQVLYRRDMAEYFRQQGFQQLGITPQMLGQAINHETAEGVKQQATASYALMSNIINDFNTSKAKANELHIAIAQQCEVNGKVNARLSKNSDGGNYFIDILAEDPDYFPLRRLNIYAANNSKDRASIKMIQQMLLTDNTIQKDFGDLVEILTNPYLIEMKQVAKDIRRRSQEEQERQRAFETEQLDKQIQARKAELEDLQSHERDLANIKGDWNYRESMLTAVGRDSGSTPTDDFTQIQQAYKIGLQEDKQNADTEVKNREVSRKEKMDEFAMQKAKQDFLLKTQEFALRKQISQDNKAIAVINPQ